MDSGVYYHKPHESFIRSREKDVGSTAAGSRTFGNDSRAHGAMGNAQGINERRGANDCRTGGSERMQLRKHAETSGGDARGGRGGAGTRPPLQHPQTISAVAGRTAGGFRSLPAAIGCGRVSNRANLVLGNFLNLPVWLFFEPID